MLLFYRTNWSILSESNSYGFIVAGKDKRNMFL